MTVILFKSTNQTELNFQQKKKVLPLYVTNMRIILPFFFSRFQCKFSIEQQQWNEDENANDRPFLKTDYICIRSFPLVT